MKKGKNVLCIVLTIVLLFFIAGTGVAQRQMERLNRGFVVISSGGGYFLSWRLFGDESLDTGFNVYRGSTKLNSSPITNATCYQDSSGGSGTYTVRAVVNGQEQAASEAARVLSNNYLSISVNIPSGYEANDASVGDLDGDGEYEIVLKVYPTNAKDNSQSGVTDPTILDAYKLDGSRMWSINLGRNIRSGAHYTQFMVYDLDGDGRAEVACKTADGTKDGAGNVIGDANANYVNSDGYILSGPEFLTVFDGQSGRALSTVDYIPPRGNVSDWGDSYGNRVDRFLACVAYLDGSNPSLVMCRGYYTRTVLAAWDFRNGSLSHRWTFDSNNNSSYAGQGNHNLSVADVDGDGRDEIVYGSCCIDDNGSGLWNSRLGHGDAMHLSDIDPDRSGLEVWGIHENADIGSALLDARTGSIIWNTGAGDIGRGCSGDLTASYKGMECWGGTDGLRSCTNARAGNTPSSTNHVVWWDGDLLRELLDGTSITKYGGSTLLSASGCSSNNGTKSNPCLQVDIWGDWREEVIWKAGSSLRIYTTTTSTNHRFHTLMHDYVYRLGIAWQNVAYNQPPHTSYYLGDGMGTPPQPNIRYAGGSATSPPTNPPADTPEPTDVPTTPPPGEPTPSPEVLTPGVTYNLQAEDAFISNGVVESDHSGYTGSGYANTANESGTYIEWTVSVDAYAEAYIEFVFANGGESNRPCQLGVNGSTWGTLDFPATGDWTAWTTASMTVNLNSGSNTIRLTATGSEGAPNIDRMDITLESGSATNPPQVTKGDVNGDGAVNIVDALVTAQYYVGLSPTPFDSTAADTNCDNTVNIVDALLIAQYYVGLISEFC